MTSTPPSLPWSVCAGQKNNIRTRATLENHNMAPKYTASSLRMFEGCCCDKKKIMTSLISYTRGSRAAVLQRMLVGSLSVSNTESISKKGALQDVNTKRFSCCQCGHISRPSSLKTICCPEFHQTFWYQHWLCNFSVE